MIGGYMAISEHLEKLRYFQKLTQYKSINEGSKAMGISQAGLSKSIASLEDAVGSPLFIRSNTGLLLTKEGELVLKTAQRILNDSASLEANLRSLQAPTSPKKLRVGMYDSIAVYFFSDLFRYIQTIYQSVDLQLVVDTSANLAEALRRNDVDLSIGVNFLNKRGQGSEFFSLFEDHYSFYVSAKNDSPEDQLPLLIHPHAEDAEGITVAQHLASVIGRRRVHRVHNFETLKALTVQGLGIGVLPTQVAKPLVQMKQLASIQIPRTKHLFGLHEIGFLASRSLMEKHREFAQDLYRLGQHWSKS